MHKQPLLAHLVPHLDPKHAQWERPDWGLSPRFCRTLAVLALGCGAFWGLVFWLVR